MADRMYRVNMSDLTVRIEEVPEKWAGLGGRGAWGALLALLAALGRRRRSGAVQPAAVHGDALAPNEPGGR